ncbi:hypothetical protein C8A00DRAFT_33245 [Chaetomidium leptoderma]|uniref:C2H2-type domain-containing protein n=1 Tax=Chaetomidium leptoderma TaxID=669021 RepID=A0AAN6VPG5_9PEZI|nr:hypothetical protein C8A00DRAFT_33245 [Chaetomidium leptoderma]
MDTWRKLWMALFPNDAAVPPPMYEPNITAEAIEMTDAVNASDSCVPITDSGYATAFVPILLGAQPGLLGEKPPSSAGAEGDGGANEDDAKTTYSAATTVAPAGARYYVSELSYEIVNRLGRSVDLKQLADGREVLPELIKAFCIRIGRESPSQINRDIMHFAHKHHRDIVSQLEAIFAGGDDGETTTKHHDLDKMSLSEKMDLWNSKAAVDPEHIPCSDILFDDVKDDDDDDDESNTLAGVLAHSNVIFQSGALIWLASSLQNRSLLQWESDGSEDLAVNKIRQQILKTLPPERISKRRQPREHQVTFWLKWGHIINRPPEEWMTRLDTVIITACSGKAQAATVKQYLSQTWPGSWEPVFGFITGDQTQITARLDGGNMVVTAAGPAYTLAECGEQLGWIAAALWPPARDSVVYYTPSILRRHVEHAFETPGSAPICFDILVDQSPVPPAEHCWADLVGLDPVVVRGFPIPRRPETYPGLETSSEILEMAGYQPTSIELGEICLRGPGRTLALVKRRGNVFFWSDVDDPACRRDEKYVANTAELGDGRHVLIPCGNVGKREDGDVVPASATPNHRGARPGMTDSDAGASHRSEMNEPGSSDSESGGTSRIGRGQQDISMPSTSNIQLSQECSPGTPCPTDTSFESDLLSVSDPSGSIASLDRRNPAMPLLRASIVRHLLSGYQAYIKGATSGSGTTGSTGSTGWGAAPASTFSGPSRSGQKRRRQQPSGDDDDDESASERSPPHKQAHKPPSSGKTPKRRILACPFWKAQPNKYKCCFTKVLSRIRDVKQHLTRIHSPAFYCDRCSTMFPDKQAHHQHVSDPDGLFCPPSIQLDSISRHQQTQISRKSNSKLSEEQQWFALWEIIFPGGAHARPASAYRDAEVSEEFCAFRDFCATCSPTTLINNAVQAMVDAGEWPGFGMVPREVRQSIVRWISRNAIELAYAEWKSTRASDDPGQSNSGGAVSAQYPTPTGSSLPDSGVAVDTLPDSGVAVDTLPPPSGGSPSDDAIVEIGGRGESVEEDSLLYLRRGEGTRQRCFGRIR